MASRFNTWSSTPRFSCSDRTTPCRAAACTSCTSDCAASARKLNVATFSCSSATFASARPTAANGSAPACRMAATSEVRSRREETAARSAARAASARSVAARRSASSSRLRATKARRALTASACFLREIWTGTGVSNEVRSGVSSRPLPGLVTISNTLFPDASLSDNAAPMTSATCRGRLEGGGGDGVTG